MKLKKNKFQNIVFHIVEKYYNYNFTVTQNHIIKMPILKLLT